MAVCAKCSNPLVVEIHPDDSDEENSDMEMDNDATTETETVPDDVHLLACNCHFHWECLLEETYELEKCPQCTRTIISSPPSGSSSTPEDQQPQILVNLNNEGGLQQSLDIFPQLREETYLRAYPEDRKARAFLEFCREGDYHAMADLLQSCADDEDGSSADKILRYQDALANNASALHLAVQHGHREVAWLLLLVASNYPELEIPAEVFQEAAALGLMRAEAVGTDIRGLRDASGRTAEDVAGDVVWNGWVGVGRLALP